MTILRYFDMDEALWSHKSHCLFFCTIIINFNLLVHTTEIGLFSLGGLLSHLQTTNYPLEKISFIRLKTIHSRFENFNFKNSQEYRHMIWNGKTNRPSQKGLVIQRACSEMSWTTLYINFPRIQYSISKKFLTPYHSWLISEMYAVSLRFADYRKYWNAVDLMTCLSRTPEEFTLSIMKNTLDWH